MNLSAMYLSEYEKQREQNMRRNHEMLVSLGLANEQVAEAPRPASVAPKPKPQSSVPTRASSRLAGQSLPNYYPGLSDEYCQREERDAERQGSRKSQRTSKPCKGEIDCPSHAPRKAKVRPDVPPPPPHSSASVQKQVPFLFNQPPMPMQVVSTTSDKISRCCPRCHKTFVGTKTGNLRKHDCFVYCQTCDAAGAGPIQYLQQSGRCAKCHNFICMARCLMCARDVPITQSGLCVFCGGDPTPL